MALATPMFGYKSQIGMTIATALSGHGRRTDAARYDGRELAKLLDPANTGSSVWADTAYRSQKHRMSLFIRTIGVERAKEKIGLANIALNFKRFLYWEQKIAMT